MIPRLIQFPVHPDPSGDLYVADGKDLPFVVTRAFWITDLHYSRGAHVLKTCKQLYIPVCGSFKVDLFTGAERTTWKLCSPSEGLYMPPMTWRVLYDFTPNSVVFVLCSHPYDPDDYIQYFDEFMEVLK